MVVCKGITVKGVQCKRNVRNGEYCCSHVSQIREVNEFYKGGEGWPTMELVHSVMRLTGKNIKKYDKQLLFNDIQYYLNFYGKHYDIYNRRLCLLLSTESMLMCRSVVLQSNECQTVLKTMISKCNEDKTGMIVEYTENFRRKLDESFRIKEGRSKYIHYIISISELGRDIADVVCGFL